LLNFPRTGQPHGASCDTGFSIERRPADSLPDHAAR
jgi:hypothetical protein